MNKWTILLGGACIFILMVAIASSVGLNRLIDIQRDSTSYYHKRYDSVVKARSWTKLDSIYKDLGKIGDYIPSEDSIRYDSTIRASIHDIHPVRHARHRKDAAYRINDTAYVSGWVDGYIFRSKEIDKDTVTIDLSKTPEWMKSLPFYDTTNPIHHN